MFKGKRSVPTALDGSEKVDSTEYSISSNNPTPPHWNGEKGKKIVTAPDQIVETKKPAI